MLFFYTIYYICEKLSDNNMKATQFILFFALISFCVTDTDPCTEQYTSTLCPANLPESTTKHCLYQDQKCLSINDCSEGDKSNCGLTFSSNYLTYKCDLKSDQSECEEKLRECSDHSTSTQINIEGSIFNVNCVVLSTATGRCDFKNEGGCSAFQDTCGGLEGTACTNNIPYDNINKHSNKCDLKDESGKTSTTCNLIKRDCNDAYLLKYHSEEMISEEFCQKLKPTDTTNGQSCHYNGKQCINGYKTCQAFRGDITTNNCNAIKPIYLDDGLTYFDEDIYKCVPESGATPSKCVSKKKKCSEFVKGSDPGICPLLEPTDNEKGCFYDTNYNPNNCKEEYTSCNDYFTKADGTKNKAKCEGFRNCVWEKGNEDDTEGTCREAYTSCEEYDTYLTKTWAEKEKKKCISIGGGNQCIFEKDEKCIDKYLLCEEATNIYDCENVAIPSKTECTGTTIGCTGIIKKRCEFIIGKGCIENYKYCSDYRAIAVDEETAKEVCERIKPYKSDEIYLDEDYKCIYDTTIGYKKKKKSCAEAKDQNQCVNLCDDLTDSKTYYAYINGECVKHYITCPDTPVASCTENIPQSFNQPNCIVDPNNSSKCKDKPAPEVEPTPTPEYTCSLYSTEEYKKTKCESYDPGNGNFCFYSSTDGCYTKTINSCSDVLKSDFPNLKEEDCNKIEVSANKICSLKADGSGCEEKTRAPICPGQLTPQDQTNPENPQNQCSSSGLKVFGIQLIVALIFLFN